MSGEDKKTKVLRKAQRNLTLFFPEDTDSFSFKAIEKGMASSDFIVGNDIILPYLQTALLDEKNLEIELDGTKNIYFSKVSGDFSNPVGAEDVSVISGDYLKQMSHLVILPLEPGMGNIHIQNSQRLTIRLFTSNRAFEFGTFFRDKVSVEDIPVLTLDFPVIGRQVKGARVFRAKVPEAMEFSLIVNGGHQNSTIRTRPNDISVKGLSFKILKEEQKLFLVGDTCKIQFKMDGRLGIKVNCTVCHVSRVRSGRGIDYRCGVQFELLTREVTSIVETVVAKVQRSHLQELFDKSLSSGINLVR